MKKIISTLLAFVILVGTMHVNAATQMMDNVAVESVADRQIIRNMDKTAVSEPVEYEPIVHTEEIEGDFNFDDEEILEATDVKNSNIAMPMALRTSSDDVWDNIYSRVFGDDYLRPYEKNKDGQRVSGNTNRLVIEETDLALPGKNGLDLKITRRHDNQEYPFYYSYYYDSSYQDVYYSRYVHAFKNTTTNKIIYVAFFTDDEMYTYMYNGCHIRTLTGDGDHTCEKTE